MKTQDDHIEEPYGLPAFTLPLHLSELRAPRSLPRPIVVTR